MKKSGSMKRQDFERFLLLNMDKQERQPGKPPPSPQLVALQASAATPPLRGGAAVDVSTPNYMKSTSCSEARKERSQVSSSSRSYQTSSPGSINSRRKSLISSRVLSRMTSSLKTMRVLTKAPSFKPARTSARKCSPVVSFKPARTSARKCSSVILCENLDVQRSTCSSTLKDSKFPSYLSLNPGGTESEGTSVMKVCPYNYCSLNGHRHEPVPPLKKFLSGKRLVIKTQRGLKLGCLSPRRSRSASDGVSVDGEVRSQDELYNSTISPLIQEDHGEFFVEIYGGRKEDGVDDQTGICQSGFSSVSDGMKQNTEDRELCTDSDSGENFGQNEENGADEEISVLSMAEEETELGSITGITGEDMQTFQSDEADSDASDMDWEAGEYSAFYLDDYLDYSLEEMEESQQKGNDSLEVDGCIATEESVLSPVEDVSSCFDEFPADEERWSSESTGSSEYLDNLNIEITSFPFVDQMGKLEAAKEDKNDILFPDLDGEGEKQNIMEPEEGGSVCENAGCQGSDVSDNGSSGNPSEKYKDKVGSPETVEEYQSGADNIHPLNKEALDRVGFPVCEDSGTDRYYGIPTELPTNENGNEVDMEDHSDAANSTGTKTSDEESRNMAENFRNLLAVDPEEGTCLGLSELPEAENGDQMVHKEANNANTAETKDNCLTAKLRESDTSETSIKLKATARCKKSIGTCDDESREFNPREPNFLALEPDPEAEKVDLKHQMMDERKNAEEWMIDYALRQAVTKLAPARKRKVALLVEAFEKVSPSEPHLTHNSATFGHARPIQACR